MLQKQFIYLFICWNFRNANACSSRFGCEWCLKYCNKTFRPDHEKFCGYKGRCCEVKPTPPTTGSPFTPDTTSNITFTPPEKKKKKPNVAAIVVPVVLVLIALSVLLTVGWLYIGKQKNNKKTTEEKQNDGNINIIGNTNLNYPPLEDGDPQITDRGTTKITADGDLIEEDRQIIGQGTIQLNENGDLICWTHHILSEYLIS